MVIAPGTFILNKYRILKLIGEGGSGRVWLAEEVTFSNRQVAIKAPHTDLPASDLADLQRCYQQELKVNALLEATGAPNLVRALTVEPVDGSSLLVMTYMAGGDIAALLRQQSAPLTIEHTVAIIQDILRPLQAAHEHPLGIVHRDIKPQNILLDANGKAHLADFGLAQLAGVSGRSQLSVRTHPGSPLYMAPEQAQSTDYLTPAADIYALGCVWFELLTGKPYKRVRPGTLVSSLRADIPPWLDQVLSKILAEDPFDRYEDAGVLASALNAVQTATPVASKIVGVPPSVTTHQSTFYPRPRRWWLWGSTMVIVSVVIVSVAVGLFYWVGTGLLGIQLLPNPSSTGTPTEPARSGTEVATTEIPTSVSHLSTSIATTSIATNTPTLLSTPTLSLGVLPTAIATETPPSTNTPTPTNTPTLLPTPTIGIGVTKIAPLPSGRQMIFVYVPTGEFLLGSPAGEGNKAEHPQSTIPVDAFWIGQTEVTNVQFREFVDAGGYSEQSWWTDAGWEWLQTNSNITWWEWFQGNSNITKPRYWDNGNYIEFNGDNQPVIGVSWYEAVAYTKWLSKQVGETVRLPTEAEWEKAATWDLEGARKHTYPWGNEPPTAQLLNYNGNVGHTRNVGTYPDGKSPYGAFDMAGNVWEWTATEWLENYVNYTALVDNRTEGGVATYRVVRGGSWDNSWTHARSAYRVRFRTNFWHDYLGFRVVVDIDR